MKDGIWLVITLVLVAGSLYLFYFGDCDTLIRFSSVGQMPARCL